MSEIPSPSDSDLQRLEQTLHTEIPLTRAMGVRVAGYDTRGLTLAAPLALNINHKHTAFGGSLATLATVAGWGLIQLLWRGPAPITVVIQESRVQYRHPVTGDFTASCAPPPSETLDKFRRQVERRGIARLDLRVTIPTDDRTAVDFEGRYVALDKTRYPAHPST